MTLADSSAASEECDREDNSANDNEPNRWKGDIVLENFGRLLYFQVNQDPDNEEREAAKL